MKTFIEDVKTQATEYLEYEPKSLTVHLAIELFKNCRAYPKSYSGEEILADMKANVSQIAMAVTEIDAKEGVEGQVAHGENGINRTYGSNSILLAYLGVLPIANFF